MQDQKLYQCAGCSHLYMEKVSSCDCMENPDHLFKIFVAVGQHYLEALREDNKQLAACPNAARYRALRQSTSLQVHQVCPDGLASVRLTPAEIDAAADRTINSIAASAQPSSAAAH